MVKLVRLISFVVFLCLYCTAQAQNKPSWVNGFFRDLPNSYITVGIGEGRNDMEAREKAEQKVVADNKHVIGVSEDTKIRVRMRVVDAYYEPSPNGRRAYVLVQVSKFTNFDIAEEVKVTNDYNLVAESFIPGMSQIKKGQTGKGIAFIAAEALCVGGIIIGEAQRSSWNSKIKTTQSAQQKLSYKDKADNWATMRNIAIGGAVAVYAWNIIDGIVAKGKTQIVGSDGKRYAFSPYYASETFASPGGVGLAMNITF